MEQFRSDYGLNEQNFSLCYYDTVTGEEYRYNDGCFMVAASTFKLPLNLYYYELEQSGQLSPDSLVGGMRLADAHYQSLVWSNNDVSIAMLYNLGSFRTYKELMRKYFTMEDSQITSAYYADNNYCTAMMLDALRYLYERRDQFDEMIGYMKQAQPGSILPAIWTAMRWRTNTGITWTTTRALLRSTTSALFSRPSRFFWRSIPPMRPAGKRSWRAPASC